jgi:hypothetical protein
MGHDLPEDDVHIGKAQQFPPMGNHNHTQCALDLQVQSPCFLPSLPIIKEQQIGTLSLRKSDGVPFTCVQRQRLQFLGQLSLNKLDNGQMLTLNCRTIDCGLQDNSGSRLSGLP